MPRIYGCFDYPFDFCKSCFPNEEDFHDGVNNGYNAEHPPYEGEEYDCEYCGKRLTAEDN